MQLSEKDIRRFQNHYVTEPNSGCWLWQSSFTRNGYGQFRIQRTTMRAHRLSWSMLNGPVPAGKMIRHKCDVRCCVNPNHLEPGTASENYWDRARVGNLTHGERNGCAKLTEKQVRLIRSMPGKHRVIAAKFSISTSWVTRLKNQEKWTHLKENK